MLENELNKLKNIEKVEPSPFIFTRIESRIEGEAFQRVSLRQLIPMSIGFCILFSINVFTISNKAKNSSLSEVEVISDFIGESSNQLYNE